MPFQPETTINKVPTEIGCMGIMFFRGKAQLLPELEGELGETVEAALYDMLGVLDQDGNVMNWRRGNLVPHLTPQEIAGLRALVDRLWGVAENEILP